MEKIFNNTKTAFALKSDTELDRAYFLFKMIQSEPLVRIGTAITNFALKAHMPVEQLIRASVFDHFCGGVNEEDCMSVIEKMYTKNVHTTLDYSVEGKEDESQFDLTLEKILQNIEFAREKKSIPFAVFKPTGFGRFKIYQKLTEKIALSEEEQEEWGRVVNRFDIACKSAYEKDVPLLIDAEESWMQDAADDLTEQMMEKYNKNKAIVFNTLQMYRWDRLDYLKKLHKRSQEKKYCIGMKVVRGAYMEKERDRAEDKGYKSPICKNKQATDTNYNAAIEFMMNNNNLALFAGTHNEESSYILMQLAKEKGILKNDERLWFGQLYGMSDHISFNLADEGYNVAKYLPYGPVRDVMPSRELNLLKTERKRRKV